MKDLKLYYLIGALILGSYLVVQYNKPAEVNWSPTYLRKDKIPFGTYVLFERLRDVFPKSTIVPTHQTLYSVLKADSAGSAAYLVVAPTIALSKVDVEEAVKFMRAGGQLLVASYDPGKVLSTKLGLEIRSESPDKKGAYLQFTDSLLRSRKYSFDKDIGIQFFHKMSRSNLEILGVNSFGHPNFLRYSFGKGALYLLPSPEFFSNYAMLYPGGAQYSEMLLSHLRPAGKVYWDGYFTHDQRLDDQSMMQVIFRYPALEKAYLIALLSLLLFVLFQVKRRQRVIPVIEPLKNTTAEFVQVVGQVYFQQRDHQNIAVKNVNYLMEHLRSRYRLTATDLSGNFSELLALRSGAGIALTTELQQAVQSVRSGDPVSDQELIRIHQLIEKFYQPFKTTTG